MRLRICRSCRNLLILFFPLNQKRGESILQRQGQISVFILIGTAILIVMAFGFYIFKLTTVTQFEEKAEIAAFELKSKQLDNYVSLCLRQVMNNGLKRLGQQGGFINEPPNPLDVDSRRTNIAMPRFSEFGTTEYPFPPDYPAHGFSIFSTELYPFSGKSLPFLCQRGGPNDASVLEYARPCPFGSYGEESLQKDLGLYASHELKECVDASLLHEISGFEVETRDPQVTIVLGEESILAQAKFPITLAAEGEQTTKYFDFDTEIPVRLRKVFGLAEYLINNDRYYLNFLMNESYLQPQWRTEFYDNNINISKRCPRCGPPGGSPSNYVDVINITDKLSTIGGESFSFFFAVQPRPPVLDWIHQSTTTPYGREWDYVVVEGSTITIEAKGADPDEDRIRFVFSGWKQDYAEQWDTTIPGCEDMSFDDVRLDEEQSPFDCMRYRDFWSDEDRMEVHENIATIQTKIAYHDNEGNVIGRLDADLGAHTVTVEVIDEHGMRDWQNVTILVIGEPQAEARLGCYFPDAPSVCQKEDGTPIISLEDPFVLDASASVGLLEGGSANFEWQFLRPDSTSITDSITTRETSLVAPPNISIMVIYRHIFMETGDYVINLLLPDMPGVSDAVPVEVVSCLPYRKDDMNIVPPYPYNRTDPFLSAHACCNADFTVSGPERKCFEEKTYGSYFTFDDTRYKHAPTGLATYTVAWQTRDGETDTRALGSEPDLLETPGIDNDIFERTFRRSCAAGEGEGPGEAVRGNICAGSADETRRVITTGECADYQKPNQDERCEGPPEIIPPAGTIRCEDYAPGITFERRYDRPDKMGRVANGTCIEIPAPSSNNGGRYNSSGPFFCVAQCNNGGECSYAANCVCQNTNNPSGGDSQCNGLQASLFASGSDGVGYTPSGTRVFCTSACRTVEADSSAASCQWIVRGSLPALPGLYTASRPIDKRCCGDDASEILTTTNGRTTCCSEANSCVMPDGSCLGNNQISADNQYYCYSNDLKACSPTNECRYFGDSYCNGEDWIPFAPPRTTTDNLLCGTGADTTMSYCGQCQTGVCAAKPDFCPPEEPICGRIGSEFRCQAA